MAIQQGWMETVMIGCTDQVKQSQPLMACSQHLSFIEAVNDQEAAEKAVAMAKDGKKTVAWDFVYIPSEEWKKNLKQALIAYAADNSKWDGVKNAFVDGWKTEKAASE